MSEAPLLCLLPGLLCDGAVWEPQIQALSGAARIHVADLMGPDSFPGMARRVLDETSGPLAVAGHSMGARVALEMWRLAPERIDRLALMSTGVHPAEPDEEGDRMALVELAYAQGMEAVANAWLPPMVHPDRIADRELMDPLVAMVCRSTPQILESQQRAGLRRPDAAGYLPRIRRPTLVLCGLQDSWSPPARHREMARRIAGAHLCIIDCCGHMAMVEQPREVSAALQDWLVMPAAADI